MNLTQDQLFFVNFGQVWCGKHSKKGLNRVLNSDSHSLGMYRVIGSTSNSEEFANAFKCKPCQGNNPNRKCKVW